MPLKKSLILTVVHIFIFFLFLLLIADQLFLSFSWAGDITEITLNWGDGTKCTISKNQKWINKPIVDSKGKRNILYQKDWLDDNGDLHTWYDPETGIHHVYKNKNPKDCTIEQSHKYSDGTKEKTTFSPPDTGSSLNVIAEGTTVPANERFKLYTPPDTRVILEDGEKDTQGQAWENALIRYIAKFDFPPDKTSSNIHYTINNCSWRFIPPAGFKEKSHNGFDVVYSGFAIPSSGPETFENDKYPSKIECRLIYSREEQTAEPNGPDGRSQNVMISRTYSYQTAPFCIRVADKKAPHEVTIDIPSRVYAGSALKNLKIRVKDNNPNITVNNSEMSGTLTFNPPGIFEVPGQETSNITFNYENLVLVKDFGSGDKADKYWSESEFVKNEGGRFPFYFRGTLVPVTEVNDGYQNSTGETEKTEQAISVLDNLLPNILLKVKATNLVKERYFPGCHGDFGPGETDLAAAMQKNQDFSDTQGEWVYKIDNGMLTEDARITFQVIAWDNIRRVQLNSALGDAHIKNIEYAFFNSGLDNDGVWENAGFNIHPDNNHGVITYPLTQLWRRPRKNVQLKIRVTDNADYNYEESGAAAQPFNQRTLTLIFDITDTRQHRSTIE
jgi:hypothetical protein